MSYIYGTLGGYGSMDTAGTYGGAAGGIEEDYETAGAGVGVTFLAIAGVVVVTAATLAVAAACARHYALRKTRCASGRNAAPASPFSI